MPAPNFFLIGASRSGTTSTYHYLNAHPEIFMSPVKEPRYYAYRDEKVNHSGLTDKYHINRSSVTFTPKYSALFKKAVPGRHKAIGEASPVYLYSDVAAKEIHKDVPDAKLIAILRDPVKRAYSDYLNMLRLGRDFCESFGEAVENEEERIKSNWGPFYHYVTKGFYYEQLSRYLKYFDASQLCVLTHKELVQNTPQTMERIFRFLDVDPHFEFKRFKTYNSSGVPKNIALHKAITHPLLPLPNFIKNLNITYSKPEMDNELKKNLYELYKDDMEKLGAAFDLDLQHWKE